VEETPDGWTRVVIAKMIQGYSYAYEKFTSAVQSLAIGSGDVRERLRHAYLHIRILNENHLPEQLYKDYQWVLKQLKRYDPAIGPDGKVLRSSVDETLRRIHKSTGTKIAEHIFHIYVQLNWLYMQKEHGR
jgi:hypothetical protein